MNLWIETSNLPRAQALFGVPPLERLRRSVGHLAPGDLVMLSGAGAAQSAWPRARADCGTAPLGERLRRALRDARGALVAVDGAHVTDPRLIRFLASARPCVAARGEGAQRAAALCLDRSHADAIPAEATTLSAVADALLAGGKIAPLDERAFPAYIDKLRRTLPWWQYVVEDADTRRRLERQLFWDNYKGSTDLLTRWVYPPLVWPLVRVCTALGVHPNVLTALSVVLAFAAVPLWAGGHWFAGFVCAYAMSVLDSVDGKVARLMLTESKIGNVLDHGLDQVHPPFWYFAWAWGLGARTLADPMYLAAVWLIVFYVADRLVLGIARYKLGSALHAATRLDALARAVIARRNITMTIMAIALALGAGDAGLILVTAWQALTFAWHTLRTVWVGFLFPPAASSKPR
ncbi:MAG: CDP-alcohol phosphatidyltransferase family protein [Burkholderiales bacterium]|nr:CDP-alcohol phosphatidyltransferase family protein [Burkholderiales bacterium]